MKSRGNITVSLSGLLIGVAAVFIATLEFRDRYSPAPVFEELAKRPDVTVKYYDIYGASLIDLRQSMDRLGPVDTQMRVRDAYTHWKILWNWPFKEGGKANFESARAECQVTVTLPRWADLEGAPKQMVKTWQNFIEAIKAHEAFHIDNVLSKCLAIPTAIREASRQKTEFSYSEANSVANEIVRRIRESDREFDLNTNNGRKRGVVLP